MGCCASSEALSAEHLASRVRTARTTRSLALKGAGLKAIPPQVLELGARLHVLDLSGNPGIDLSGLDQLTGLRKLAVASCGLVALPSLAPLTSLAELNASSNAIAIVGTLPPSVKVLALAFNGLRSLPPAVTCGSAIQSLDLTGNDGLALGAEVAELTELTELLVARCGLETLSDVPWASMHKLKTVDAGFNSIRISSHTVPSSLLVDTALSKLVLQGNPEASQAALMAVPGFDAFAARRKSRLDKVIAGGFSKDHDLLSS